MAELTPRARRFLLALGGLYALDNAFIRVHSGGDFVFHLRLAERLLQGQPVYADFDGSIGLPWPPFAIVTLVPFALLARLSLPLTKAAWAIGNVALFGWCLVRGYRHAGRWTPVVLAVAAVAQPLQSNFQHLNINLVLLALVVRHCRPRARTGDACGTLDWRGHGAQGLSRGHFSLLSHAGPLAASGGGRHGRSGAHVSRGDPRGIQRRRQRVGLCALGADRPEHSGAGRPVDRRTRGALGWERHHGRDPGSARDRRSGGGAVGRAGGPGNRVRGSDARPARGPSLAPPPAPLIYPLL